MYVTCTSQALQIHTGVLLWSRAPSQYPKRRLSARSRKVSKPRDRYFKLSCRTAAEVPVKFQSDRTILNSNLAASRLYEILRKDVFSDIETWQSNGVAIAQNWPQSHQAASEIDTFNTIAYLINVQITKFYFSSMVRIDRTEFVHSKYWGACYRRYLLST